MISAETGDVSFTNGLLIRAHSTFQTVFRDCHYGGYVITSEVKTIPFSKLDLGILPSDQGLFDTYLVTDQKDQIVAVFLSAQIESLDYETHHNQIILDELRGQTEFHWGTVSARMRWLSVVYSDSTAVPKTEEIHSAVLYAHAELPR